MAEVNQENGRKAEESRRQSRAGLSLEYQASCFSRAFLTWLDPLLELGTERAITVEDLGALSNEDEAQSLYEKFDKLWRAEVELNGLEDASLFNVLLDVMGRGTLAFAFTMSCLFAFSAVVPAMITNMLLKHFEGTSTLPTWGLVCLIALVGIIPFLRSLFQANCMLMAKRASMHCFSCLTVAIFRKSLRMRALNIESTGYIVNLMSVDAGSAIERAVMMSFPLVNGIPTLIACFWLLYNELGVAMLFGFAFVFCIFPFTLVIFSNIKRLTLAIVRSTDVRMKFVNELVQGIRIIKCYAWENAFRSKINEARSCELELIWQHALWLQVGLTTIFMMLPIYLQCISISSYYAIGGDMSASRIFTALQLFQAMQQPLTQFPNCKSIKIVLASRHISR